MTDTKRTAIYKLVKKNQFTFQIKNGRKVMETFRSVSGGWANTCQIFDTLEMAIENYVELVESFAESMGNPVQIKIEK